MESQKIKDMRRAKFLAKLESQKKGNKKDTNKQVSLNNTIQQETNNQQNIFTNNFQNNPNISNNNNINNGNFPPNNISDNLNSINNLLNPNLMNNQQKNIINNNNYNNQFIPNYQSAAKINFNEIMTKMNQFDYMVNFQSILKKILIIILSLLHCFKYQPLENDFVLKYTLVVLEISSLLFNKYYRDQKKELTKNFSNTVSGQPPALIEKISQFLLQNFGGFGWFFFIIKLTADIFSDIAILVIINILYFLFNSI